MKFFLPKPLTAACVLLLSMSQSHAAQRLNDTGIQYGGDYPQGINTSCEAKITDDSAKGNILPQQDCATGPSAKIKDANQSVFEYKKVDASGKALSDSAKKWQCVTDSVTGLMWEVKQKDKASAGLHHVDDLFTWYNSDRKTNGGKIGYWNNLGDKCSGYTEGKPRTYCHVEQFVARVNKQGLCGHNDWRLPTQPELSSLIHYGEFEPAIASDYFPNTLNNFYWTKSPMAGRNAEAWAISFQFGFATPLLKTDLRPARLVRTVK